MMDSDRALTVAGDLAEAVRAHAGTEYHAGLMRMLEALKVSYMHEFVNTPIDSPRIAELQGAAKQVLALERALGGSRPDSPRI